MTNLFTRLIQNNKLSDEELENVTDGSSCSTYSDDTYDQLGIYPSLNKGQQGSYHPLIVTTLNSCSFYKGKGDGYCVGCIFYDSSAHLIIHYCRARSRECDFG